MVNGAEEGKGENGGGNSDGNGESGPSGAEQGRGRRKERRAGVGRAAGAEEKNGARWSGMCKHTGRPTSGTVPIIFGTYNIRNGRNSGLEAAMLGVSQANMDLGIFQKTKLTDGIYTRRSDGYIVVAADTKPTPRRRGNLSPAGAALRGGGGATVRTESHRVPTGDGGAGMVHCGVLPHPRRHLDNREGCRSAQGALQESGAAGGGRPKHKFRGSGGRPERGRYSGYSRDGGTGGHGTALPPAAAPLVSGQEDVGNATEGTVGAVPDRLYPGDRPSSLQECLRPGPSAQLIPLHVAGLPAKRLPDRTQDIPRGTEEISSEAADKTNEGG